MLLHHHHLQLLIQAHFAQLMSDSDEFEYESDDDPYGGAEEEAMLSVYLSVYLVQDVQAVAIVDIVDCMPGTGTLQDGDEEAIQIENTFYEVSNQELRCPCTQLIQTMKQMDV